MHRFLPLVLLLLLAACKKDLLHWQSAERLNTGTNYRLNRIVFKDQIGIIVGGDRFAAAYILRSSNGGISWTGQNIPEAGKALYGVTIADWGDVYACGYEGNLLRSTNAGISWTFHQIPTWKTAKGIAFSSPNRGTVIGGVSFYDGNRIQTDAACNFYTADSAGHEYNDVAMSNPAIGYLVGYGVVQKTIDSTRSWHYLSPTKDNFISVDVHGPDTAYICGYEGSIYATGNGGKSWNRLRHSIDLSHPRYHLLDLLFTDAEHGYSVGENGIVLYTDNAGQDWMEYERFTHAHLRSIARRADGRLLVCGDNGELWALNP